MKLLAVDANSVLNRAFYGIKPLTNKDGVPTNAIYGFLTILLKLLEDLHPDGAVFAFDLKAPTFRHQADSRYKANRKGMPEDLAQQLPLIKELLTDLGYQVLRADECHKMGMEAVLKAIRARVGSAKAFLTFDIDFLDPAYAPGTGTPVPGGFTTAQALELVRGLADLNIVGYDVVEVSPPYDPTGLTSIAAAGLMQEFISHGAYKKKNGIVF